MAKWVNPPVRYVEIHLHPCKRRLVGENPDDVLYFNMVGEVRVEQWDYFIQEDRGCEHIIPRDSVRYIRIFPDVPSEEE